jgi:hypothetical protein
VGKTVPQRQPRVGPSFLIGLGMLVSLGLVTPPAWGADLRGRVTLRNGQPVANEPIKLDGKEIGRTDVAGVYWLNLPAGPHKLSVKGQPVEVNVSPNGSRRDIQLP